MDGRAGTVASPWPPRQLWAPPGILPARPIASLFLAPSLSCRDAEAKRPPGPRPAWERQAHKQHFVQRGLLKKRWVSRGQEQSREREGLGGPGTPAPQWGSPPPPAPWGTACLVWGDAPTSGIESQAHSSRWDVACGLPSPRVMAASPPPWASLDPTLRPCAHPCPRPQPAPDASPMKRSISTLAPQRPPVARLCNAALDRAPASQAAPHHHHRCHRRRDRKPRSLEKGPSLSADTDGGACEGSLEGRWLELGVQEHTGTLFLSAPHNPTASPEPETRQERPPALPWGPLLALGGQAGVGSVSPPVWLC